MTASLIRETVDQTMVLTLSNPEHRNALGPEMYSVAVLALQEASSDPAIRTVMLTGAGDHFCGGGQLQRLLKNRGLSPAVQAASIDQLHTWVMAIKTCTKPVIAAVEGAAAGAGFSLALACDFIVASENAKFVMAYTSVALSPDGGGSWHLARALPHQLATELMMTAQPIGAARLSGLGIVNCVTAPGQALQVALQLAQQLAKRAPNALASVKRLICAANDTDLTEHLGKERDHFVNNLHHANAEEGIAAFLSKRPAQYP